MEYDQGYWSDYARDNEDRYNGEFAAFVRNLVSSLHCGSVLEIGCSTGIDLRLMDEQVRVFGADLNEGALEVARAKMPRGDFRVCDITRLPFGDSSMDFVFTHQLLNYLDDRTLEAGMAEMLRVAGRYIMSCEMYGTDGGVIDGAYRYRDMYRRWLGHEVRIISNVEMHPDIEPDKARFVLIKVL